NDLRDDLGDVAGAGIAGYATSIPAADLAAPEIAAKHLSGRGALRVHHAPAFRGASTVREPRRAACFTAPALRATGSTPPAASHASRSARAYLTARPIFRCGGGGVRLPTMPV